VANVQNRRNFYRLLQVQPDAAPEVIKAAYRALMALHHPDKGGDQEVASLITNAYATLSDVQRRKAYDTMRGDKTAKQRTREPQRPATDVPPASRAPAPDCCPLCAAVIPAPLPRERSATRCSRCKAPLTRVKLPAGQATKERRGMPRVSKSDWALMHVVWNADGLDVRMRDLSLDGISVYCGAAFPIHRRVRIVGASFDVVADIVSCRRVGNVYTLHAQLISALFTNDVGGFVSTTA
jgi:hypothetical protein